LSSDFAILVFTRALLIINKYIFILLVVVVGGCGIVDNYQKTALKAKF
jgi:hypothetical protein